MSIHWREFEKKCKSYWEQENNYDLTEPFPIEIGHDIKKLHNFDYGNEYEKIVIECKCHSWTSTDKIPYAKLSSWNESMYFFSLVQNDFRKIFFVAKDVNSRGISLVDYYIKNYKNLIPNKVEIWEYDTEKDNCEKQYP